MTADYIDDVLTLLSEAEALEPGETRVGLHEEAVRRADSHNDEELAFHTRLALMEAATFSGEMDKALVAFAWCLGKSDADPERFPETDLLWNYRWAVQMMSEYPQFSKQQIAAAVKDMTRRYRRVGSTMQAVYMQRYLLATNLGDQRALKRYFRLFTDTPSDFLSNGRCFDLSQTVHHHLRLGDDAQAYKKAQPILQGKLKTETEPQSTLASLLLPLVRMGRLEEAANAHRRGYPLVRRNPFHLDDVAEHMTYLAVVGNLKRALALLEQHAVWAQRPCTPLLCFDFYLAALFVLERVAQTARPAVKLRLPSHFTLFERRDEYPVEELRQWFADQCQDLADRFDQRNGNKHFSGRVRDRRKWHQFAAKLAKENSANRG